MDILILVCLFFLTTLTSIPVAIAIGFTVLIFSLLFAGEVGSISFIFQNMYSSLNNFPLLAIPFFMLAGAIMETGGLSKRLVNVANQLVGHCTAGLAFVTVLACMFFGAISGSAPATVAAIGGIMIPAMVKRNYSKEFSAGLISVSGSLGVVVPPSIPFIIYGIATSTSVSDLFLAGIVPGFLVAGLLMLTSYIIGRKKGYKGGAHTFVMSEFLKALWDAKWALAMPVVILGGIYGGIFTPTEAAVIGVFIGLIAGLFVYRELTLRGLVRVVVDNGSLVGAFTLMFATANSLAFIVSVIDLPYRLVDLINAVTTNKFVILAIINVFLLFVGMFLDATSANLVFSPLLLAIVQPLGVNPVHFGIIVTINLCIGFVTPPFAGNIFLTSTLTNVPVMDIIKSSFPFVIAMFLALILVTYIPAICLIPFAIFR